MDRGPLHASEDVPSRRAVVRAAARLPVTAAALGITTLVLPTAAAAASDGGIAPAGGALDVRTYLSAAGRTAHDAVGAGDLFVVDADDYAAVRTGLASTHDVTTTGMSDALMLERGSANWATAYATTLGDSVWPAGGCLLGGEFGVDPALTPSVTILRGTSATGDHVAVGAAATGVIGTVQLYVLRRDPVVTATAATLACVGARGRTTTSASFHYATGTVDVDGVPTYRTWIATTTAPPRQQYLVATPR